MKGASPSHRGKEKIPEFQPSNPELRTANTELSCAVVIASFRPGPVIDQCLRALLAQQGVDIFQIIVVDSSADGTAERLRQAFPTVQVITLDRQTHKSSARNIGIARTQA